MGQTLLEFFVEEAGDYLEKLRQALGASGAPDAGELRRLARALRGSARMADQEAIVRAAAAVQGLADDLASGRRHWGTHTRHALESAVNEIREMIRSVEASTPDLAHRADALTRRLGEATNPLPPSPKDRERFRRFLGTELRGLASEIGEALAVLERDPRNRDPLKKLLRRIRPLRGIEGVDQIPAVGAAVAAVEEVILRIADTSATVGPGHLVLFRRAQQALAEVATALIRGEEPGGSAVGGAEIEDLKEQILDTAAQRQITWISELFDDETAGPHLAACPMADQGAGSWEAFFILEATGSLDTVDRLRTELAAGGDSLRKTAEQLAFTFRQLRERAVTFGHRDLGRVARRAGAAVAAALQGPRWQLQTLGVEIGDTAAALRAYLEARSDEERLQALERAEETLQFAAHPAEEKVVEIESLLLTAEDALLRAREISGQIDGLLRFGDPPDVDRAHQLLEEAVGLVEHALGKGNAQA